MLKNILILLFVIFILAGCMDKSENNLSAQKRIIIKDKTTGEVSNIYEYSNSKITRKVTTGDEFRGSTVTNYNYNEDGLLLEENSLNNKTGKRECVTYSYEKTETPETKSNEDRTETMTRTSSTGEVVVYHIGYENGEMVGVVEENKNDGSIFSKSFK